MHAHSHGKHHHQGPVGVLRWSVGITFIYVIVTAVAGVRAHSLALLSEAGHNFSDVLALALSLAAVYIQTRPPDSSKTYGYQRAGVLAAFINAASLVALSFLIFYAAAERFVNPQPVQTGIMMGVAAAGVLMNGGIALALFKNSRDVNLRSAFLHMLGDTVSTSAVIAGGAMIRVSGRYWIDPALSFGIAALILWSAMGIVRETLNILLEGTPRGIHLEKVANAIRAVEGVIDVHDLHIWSLGSETRALSCHIQIADAPISATDRILQQVNSSLQQLFHIDHTTIQFENVVCEVAHGCVMPTSSQHQH